MEQVLRQLKNIVSVDDMDPKWIHELFTRTSTLKYAHQRGLDDPEWYNFSTCLARRVMISLFYEASTRTRLSFESAMCQLGGQVIGTEAAKLFSSTTKGETLEDTIRVCAGYGHVIVLRHSERGSATKAAELNVCPIINAGDGDGEHPTQAQLDIYTIIEKFGRGNKLRMSLVGDLRHGRTVHSLVKIAIKLEIVSGFDLISPEGLELPEEYRVLMDASGVEYTLHQSLNPEVLERSDVIYMTRVQKERAVGIITPDGNAYALSPALAKFLKASAIIMHPLPRNAELPDEIDRLPQAYYFEQAHNGLYIRMAILLTVLGK